MFKGSITALITPFKNDGIDFQALEKLILKQIEAKSDGIVLMGSTGEGATIDDFERAEIIESSVKFVNKRIKVIIGTSTNDTNSTIRYTKQAHAFGADGALIVAPYYNKPNQLGILKHFQAVAQSCPLPIIIYNNPARAVVNIADETTAELAKLENIHSLKDCSFDVSRLLTLKTHNLKKEFTYLVGDDINMVAFNANGGDGLISTIGNIIPGLCVQIQQLCAMGDFKGALSIQQSLVPLYQAIGKETNPVPIKYAASLMGLCEPDVRLPLVEMEAGNKEIVKNALKKLNLI